MSGVTKKPRTRWGTGRIAVSAKWPEIAAALQANWPLTMIFEKHMDAAEISYSQFRRQVHRLQQTMDPKLPAAVAAPSPAPTTTDGQQSDGSTSSRFGKDYDPTIDPVRLQRLTGSKPKAG